MINVSDEYKEAIDAPTRSIKSKVEVYFDGYDALPTVFTDDDTVISVKLLEELKADSDSPLGLVSANELCVELYNHDHSFTTTNEDSPYYRKLIPDVLVKPYLLVSLELDAEDEVFEEVPLGVFRTRDWSAPSGSAVATVVCYDRIVSIGQMEIPMLRAMPDVDIYTLFEILFIAIGLSPDEYIIDEYLRHIKVKLGWFPNGVVLSGLQMLAIAGNCSVTADRYGRIVAKSNFTSNEPVASFTEDTQLSIVNNPPQAQNIYSSVYVNYAMPVIKETSNILQMNNLVVPHGGITLYNVTFSNLAYSVGRVNLLGAQNALILSVEFGVHKATIDIINPGPDETVTLEVYGKTIDTIVATCHVYDRQAIKHVGDRGLSIDNYLIQDKLTARRYAASLLNLLKNPLNKYTATIRGNPAVETGDTITLVSDTIKLGSVDVVLHRVNLEYTGGLRADIDCMLHLAPIDWVFLGPGLSALTPRRIK